MKTIIKILPVGLLILILTIGSCKKSEYDPYENYEVPQEEGFISKTGENDSEIEISSEIIKPLLHKRYAASLSKEEASALFDEEIAKFRKENQHTSRTASSFNFKVQTRTSNWAHSQTDGSVWARINFLTDKGPKNVPWFPLNNAGDDRENGAWDFYLFGRHAPSISWLEAKNSSLALKGTDGWHVKYFDVRVYSWDQPPTNSASGSTRILSNPEIWLDNNNANGWDFYHTGNVGTDRINFN